MDPASRPRAGDWLPPRWIIASRSARWCSAWQRKSRWRSTIRPLSKRVSPVSSRSCKASARKSAANDMKPLVIAVDGPAASGKGTLARRLAKALGLPYLDTGLLYRAVARAVLDAGGNPADPALAASAARALTPAALERTDLRTPEVDRAASMVAQLPEVRAALLDFQRNFAAEHGAVLDGRDIGTVVLPDAPIKLFVTASLAERAKRHRADVERTVAPLRPAADAVLLDTTTLDVEAAFRAAQAIVRERLAAMNASSLT